MKKKAAMASPDVLTLVLRMADAVKRARKRRRLTQRQLATRAGIGLQTVNRLERGEPGIALGSYLEVLSVLDEQWPRALLEVIDADRLGHALETARLPQRVKPDAF